MKSLLVSSALLVLLPLTSLAQQPILYAGIGANLMRFAPFQSNASTHVGPAMLVGLNLGPRWALELQAQLTWHPQADSTASGAQSQTAPLDLHSTALVVPLLLRYCCTKPAAPLRLEVLGGASWLHGGEPMGDHYNLTTQHFEPNQATNQVGLVLGPQLGYALGRTVDLKFSVPFNLAVTGNQQRTFGERVFMAPQVSVQYALVR